jgi:hypothetical protein
MGGQKKKFYVKKDKSDTSAEYDVKKAALRDQAMELYDSWTAINHI